MIGLLLLLAAYRSPRNRLAFEIPIDEAELQRVYDTHRSNPLAQRAAWYAAVALTLPFASAVTLVMGLRALRRANPNAWPPRGGRTPARIGIGLSAVGLLGWSLLTLALIARFL